MTESFVPVTEQPMHSAWTVVSAGSSAVASFARLPHRLHELDQNAEGQTILGRGSGS